MYPYEVGHEHADHAENNLQTGSEAREYHDPENHCPYGSPAPLDQEMHGRHGGRNHKDRGRDGHD